MKTKLTALVFFLFIFSYNIKSQDFSLYNPSNELYLFSAYDEGANAFRYNPAVLGLGHRLNVTLNGFFQNYGGKVYINEGDFLLNSGSFGFAYRRFTENDNTVNRSLNQFSLGLGFGNKTTSAGMVFEALYVTNEGRPGSFEHERETKYKFGFGLLWRPAEFISAAFKVKTGESLSLHDVLVPKYTVGLGARPLGNDIVTLLADFSITPYYNQGFFDFNTFKTGLDIKVRNGLYVNGTYNIVNNPDQKNMFTVGFRFDFPHTSIRYNNSFSRTDQNASYSENYPFRSLGNHVSLSFSLEKRKTFVPEKKKIIEITLSGTLQDYNTEDVFFGLLGKGKRSVHEVIADIDYAAADPSVKGMLLKIYPLSTGRFEVNAAIEELTASLERFKARNKTITAYFPQDAGPGEYYLATYADDIVLPPEAIFFYGLSIEVMNYHAFLKKYGIDPPVIHAEKYNLSFQGLLDSTSEEGKDVINRILDIVYEKMLGRVITSRNIVIDDYIRGKLSEPLTGTEALRLGL